MHARDALKLCIDASDFVATGYLEDLSDEELFHRPAAGCNHINWQVGHLISSDNFMLDKAMPGAAPALPPGFAERYTADTAASDDRSRFCTKAELMQAYREQRAATLAALQRATDEDLDRPSGLDWAPTGAALFSMQGSHWLMHVGQWAVIRRQLGRKPLY